MTTLLAYILTVTAITAAAIAWYFYHEAQFWRAEYDAERKLYNAMCADLDALMRAVDVAMQADAEPASVDATQGGATLPPAMRFSRN